MPQLEDETMTAIANVIDADHKCIQALTRAATNPDSVELMREAFSAGARQGMAMSVLVDRLMIEGISLGQYRTKESHDA